MSSFYDSVFSKEITCLPSFLDRYVSKYYNNALSNATTWAFFLWLLLHYIFSKFINKILKQMKYPEYLRLRIITTLWNFGYCAGSFLYCYTRLAKSNLEISTFHKKIFTKNSDFIPAQYLFGFVIINAYNMQCIFWEATQNYDLIASMEYSCLVLLATLTYLNSCVEFLFIITYINSLAQCVLELSRIFSFQLYNKNIMNLISNIYFVLHVLLSIFIYLFVDSLYIALPMAKLISDKYTVEYLLLNIVLWIWILFNIHNSVLTKLIKHYIWHKCEFDETTCENSYIQCSLFPVRTDTAFHLRALRKEVEDCNSRYISRPSKRISPALGQILKCAVSFRRKVKNRRELAAQRESLENEFMAGSILDDILNKVYENDVLESIEEDAIDTNET